MFDHRHLALLTALPEERRAELIDALAPWPPEQPDMITNFFWRQLPTEEAQRLRARMWPDGSP